MRMRDLGNNRLLEGRKVWGALGRIWKESWISKEVEMDLSERVVIPTALYGSETWPLGIQEKRKVEVFEMRCLRNMCHKK